MKTFVWALIVVLLIVLGIVFFFNNNKGTNSANTVTGEWYWEKFSEEEIQSWSKSFMVETGEVIRKWQEAGVKRMLDVGAGQGPYSMRFARNGFDVDALDINEFSMQRLDKLAKEQNLNIKTVTADARKMPYADNTFDAVIAIQVINLAGCDNVVPMLNEICRVLKPNGQVWFTLDAMENMDVKHDENDKSSASLPKDRYDSEYCLFDIEKIRKTILPMMDFKQITKTTYINPKTTEANMTKYGIIGVCKK